MIYCWYLTPDKLLKCIKVPPMYVGKENVNKEVVYIYGGPATKQRNIRAGFTL